MKIRLDELRRLIRETVSTDAKAKHLAQVIVHAAHEYVESIVSGQPDDTSAEHLRTAVPQCTSLAKWMLNRREAKAEPFAVLAKDAMDFADKVGFWKRPAFLKKDKYTEEMQNMLRRLDKSYKALVS
jgi:hypothetical protein